MSLLVVLRLVVQAITELANLFNPGYGQESNQLCTRSFNSGSRPCCDVMLA